MSAETEIDVAYQVIYVDSLVRRFREIIARWAPVVEAAQELADDAPRCVDCGHLHVWTPGRPWSKHDRGEAGTWKKCSQPECGDHPLRRDSKHFIEAALSPAQRSQGVQK